MLRRRALAIVSLLLTAGLLTAGSCAPHQYRKGCDVEVIEPAVTPYEQGAGEPVGRLEAKIVGTAIARCDVVPTEHIIQVMVEEEVAPDIWVEVEGINGRLYTECDRRPQPGPGGHVTCEHIVICYEGRFRTSATVFGVDDLGPFTFSPPERPARTVRCPT